jgi:hypothetical protein
MPLKLTRDSKYKKCQFLLFLFQNFNIAGPVTGSVGITAPTASTTIGEFKPYDKINYMFIVA